VPGDPATRGQRCEEVYRIQVQGLATRLRATGTKKLVIGVSGGLDSTQALIVCARVMDELKLPRRNILAYTMPGFATSTRTRNQAWQLMRAVGATAEEIDIRPSCMQMLKDLGHPYAKGKKVYDIAFENVQAGERTSHLFRLANHHGGIVVGTGDLSELALGWSTYGVGDQMSHYNVNSSVPKTLIQHLIGWIADSGEFTDDVKRALHRVLDTDISPELIPGRQRTEDTIGPYELQDFNLYYTLRFGYPPAKVAFLAWHAWKDKYRLAVIKKKYDPQNLFHVKPLQFKFSGLNPQFALNNRGQRAHQDKVLAAADLAGGLFEKIQRRVGFTAVQIALQRVGLFLEGQVVDLQLPHLLQLRLAGADPVVQPFTSRAVRKHHAENNQQHSEHHRPPNQGIEFSLIQCFDHDAPPFPLTVMRRR